MRTKRKTTATEPTATASPEADMDASMGQAASMALAPAAQLTAPAPPAPIANPEGARIVFIKLVNTTTNRMTNLCTDFNIQEYLPTANDGEWRKYWEASPGDAEEAFTKLKSKLHFVTEHVRYD